MYAGFIWSVYVECCLLTSIDLLYYSKHVENLLGKYLFECELLIMSKG